MKMRAKSVFLARTYRPIYGRQHRIMIRMDELLSCLLNRMDTWSSNV